jgi:hypothetical protein
MKFADLHLHTFYSDGTYSPAELINAVANAGINAIAVTDHDTVDGVAPTIEEGRGKDIEVIPAIELTAEYEGLEIHILGYCIDHNNASLTQKLNFLQEFRRERIHKMVEKLKTMNVDINAQAVFDISGKGTVGRLHLARALLKAGHVDSVYMAFQKYIGEKSPAYICGFRLSPYEAIKLIKDNGGIPVLAHPHSLKRDDLIPLFVDYGLRGLEAYYPEHSQNTTDHYRNLANKYNLLVTGGSDCHGHAKPEVQLGSVKIPYALVEKLKEEKGRLK